MRTQLAVVVYTLDRCIRSQLWWPVVLVYLLVVAFAYPFGEPMLQTGSVGAILLTPVAAWLVVATVNSESVSQADVVSVSTGDYVRARGAVWLAAAIAVIALSLASALIALVREQSLSAVSLPAFAVVFAMHLVAGLPGAAMGLAAARPLVARPGFSILVVSLLSLCFLLLPMSPLRALVLLVNEGPFQFSMIGAAALIGSATVVTSLGATYAFIIVARYKT